MLWVKFADQSNLIIVLDFNAGAKVILDLTLYSDLVFGKTINEMVSKHSVNTWLDLTTFRKTGPRTIKSFYEGGIKWYLVLHFKDFLFASELSDSYAIIYSFLDSVGVSRPSIGG